MTASIPGRALPQVDDLQAYLSLHGWQQIEGGRAASIWSRQTPEDPRGVSLLLPHIERASDYVDRISMLLEELALELDQPTEKVRQDAALVHFDVAPIRAADPAIDDSIPLHAGLDLFAAARKMIVAAAGATERRASHFGRTIPNKARDHAHVVRVGQTQRGSYIVPIISRARYSLADAVPEQHLDMNVERSLYERRVMSTFASAIGTLEEIAVRRGTAPRGAELTDAVDAGVSRELCLGVLKALKSDSISKLSIGFRWAPASTPPKNAPELVEFPEEAMDSLSSVAERLRTLDLPRRDVLYGVVTELRHRPNDPERRVGVEALVGKRVRTVFMTLTPEQYEIAQACHERSKVFVRGELRAPVGDRAEMRVDYFGPDEALNLNLDDDNPPLHQVRLRPDLMGPSQAD
jgi:hypothetical protein